MYIYLDLDIKKILDFFKFSIFSSFLLLSFSTSIELHSQSLTLTGTIISNNQKMIGPRFMGYVKSIFFDIGDTVSREDTLFELESAEFDILKNQADLAIEQANMIVEMYQTRLNSISREKRMLKAKGAKGFINNMDWENLEIMSDNISASLAAAQVLVKNATEKAKQISTITGYLDIKAPNDGIIVQKRIRVGDLVAPGMLAMVIVDLNHLQVEAEVAESDLKYVNKYQRATIEVPSIDYKTIGTVKSIVPSANPMAHTFKVIIDFVKTNDKVFPGMYAKLRLHGDSEEINRLYETQK